MRGASRLAQSTAGAASPASRLTCCPQANDQGVFVHGLFS